MANKFNFYEIVKVISTDKEHSEINGHEGVVLGMSQNDDGSWGYAVDIKDDGWDIEEKHLISTGKFSTREQFYNKENSVKIIVDESGKGEIKD